MAFHNPDPALDSSSDFSFLLRGKGGSVDVELCMRLILEQEVKLEREVTINLTTLNSSIQGERFQYHSELLAI